MFERSANWLRREMAKIARNPKAAGVNKRYMGRTPFEARLALERATRMPKSATVFEAVITHTI
jgi:hypothetical protein